MPRTLNAPSIYQLLSPIGQSAWRFHVELVRLLRPRIASQTRHTVSDSTPQRLHEIDDKIDWLTAAVEEIKDNLEAKE